MMFVFKNHRPDLVKTVPDKFISSEACAGFIIPDILKVFKEDGLHISVNPETQLIEIWTYETGMWIGTIVELGEVNATDL